jgi:hypothetical protein
VTDKLPIHQGMSFYPIRKATFPLLQNVISILYGRGVTARVKGLAGVARSLWSMR